MTRRTDDPQPRKFTKPPIRRELDPDAVRQDRWARVIGACIGIAVAPILLVVVVFRHYGMAAIWVVPSGSVMVGFGLVGGLAAVAVVLAWTMFDRPR